MKGSALRVLVCGGRDYSDQDRIRAVLARLHGEKPFTCLIHGAAAGADTLAGSWASENKIPVRAFAAEWEAYGRAAGPIRNKKMLVDGKPDLVVAFPGGRGTANMVKQAKAAGVAVEVISP